MKSLYTIIFILLGVSYGLSQTPAVSIASSDLCAAKVKVFFLTENFTNVTAYSFSASWDETVIANPVLMDKHSEQSSGFLPNLSTAGTGSFIWSDGLNPVSIMDGDTLFSLEFDVLDNSNSIDFIFVDNPSQRVVTVVPIFLPEEYILGTTDGTVGCILFPTELEGFEGFWSEGETFVELSWQTSSEIDFNYFVLEKSPNGKEFTPLATIEGQGTPVDAASYVYPDKTPYSGDNYYRLKMVDYNGEYSFSPISHVKVSISSPIAFPNPVQNQLYINGLPEGEVPDNISVYDYLGKKQLLFIKDEDFSSTTNIALDLSALPVGPYLIFTDHFTSGVRKIFKVYKK